MEKLYKIIKKYSLKDALNFEKNDRQFLALEKLWKEIGEEDKISIYLSLIISNSIVCYQLSGKGEDYWEEFGERVEDYCKNSLCPSDISLQEGDITINFLSNFLRTCKNNKRFTETKIKRLEKLKPFLEKFYGKGEYFYENMLELRDLLSKTMKQKKDAKTIVFAVKMFSYGARNIFGFKEFPKEISIPIDSRLTNLFEKYRPHPNPLLQGEGIEQVSIEKFYSDLALKMNIPELHLDGIIWNLYDELIKD